MRKPSQLLAASALLVGCNAILGIGSDYHRAPKEGGPSAGDGGTSANAGASTGGKGAKGGSGNNAGSSMTSGGDPGTSGGTSSRGGSAGNSTASGGDSGSPGGDGGEVGDVGGSSGRGGSGGTGGGSGGTGGSKGGTGGNGGNAGTGGSAGSAGAGGITVQLDQTLQPIQGFGISTASMPNGKTLPIDTLFDVSGADAIGLSILRVAMNSTGSLNGKYVAEAKLKGAKVIGAVYSPPATCKSNNNTQQGGSLLPSCYDSWATTLANFASAQGLYAMSIGSDVDFASCKAAGPPCTDDYDSTTFTAKQMVSWVKAARLQFAARAPAVKIIAPEPQEWIHAWSNASATGSLATGHPNSSDPLKCGCFSNTPTETGCTTACLNGDGYDYGHWLWGDPDAWSSFDIFGVHEYDSQIAYPWPSDVNGGVRNKEVWMTEMSGFMYWPEEGPSTDIDNGLAVAGWIHSALTVGEASAWLYSWYEAYFLDDNEGLALIKGSATIAKRYYALGQYSKFVRPGFLAVAVTGNDSAVLLSAYKSMDSATTVVVAINNGTAAASPMIGFAGGTAPASCTPTVTSATDNLKGAAPVTVSGGVLSASLAGKTITTYVCN